MTIMEIAAQPDGRHRVQSRESAPSVWPPGWIKVPKRLSPAVRRYGGYCDPVVKDKGLIGVLPVAPSEVEPELEALAVGGMLTQDAYEVIILGGTYE